MTKEQIQFAPELEQAFKEYQRLEKRRSTGTSTTNMATVLLGDLSYGRPLKMPGWTVPVTMLQEPKIAIRYWNTLGIPTSKAAHRQRADSFRDLCREVENEIRDVAAFAYNTYGEKGPLTSGCLQEHFPQHIKDRLRFLNHGHTMLGDAVRLHDYLATTRSPQFK
jgi:hypothetical protein